MKAFISTKPVSPSKNISKEIFNGQEIKVALGNTSETIYSFSKKEIDKNILELKLVDGNIRKVNKNFIISLEDIKIVKVVTNTTAHSNYYSKAYKYTEVTQFFAVRKNINIEFVSEVNLKDLRNVKKIFSYNKKDSIK